MLTKLAFYFIKNTVNQQCCKILLLFKIIYSCDGKADFSADITRQSHMILQKSFYAVLVLKKHILKVKNSCAA